ncbi:hypothetical protein MACK_003485 [Theileria orientalis]|uniref:ubiquitinyl hydrolase 1 n=1 Tax=Theileria orientalis TaxID=68886 RepID=A0A976SJ64_THEOR|nr:hypothetical protein MACK_003485 [Theileria orientalis]
MESQLYWELQPLGETTCGIHALNFILQGPVFRLSELEPIVQQCINMEREFLIQAGLSQADCDQMISSESKGNFDYTVLEKALENRGYACTRVSGENLSEKLLEHKNAFLINVNNHWISSRHIGEKWLLSDSKKDEPEEVDLLDFLRDSVANKHSVFLVKDKLGKYLPLFHNENAMLAANQKCRPLNS